MRQYLIFGIFLWIYQKKKTTAKEIAEHFEISQRNVYRYIDALCYAEIPLYTQKGKNGGIFIDADFKTPSFYFSNEEMETLKKLVLSAKQENSQPIFDSILKKI